MVTDQKCELRPEGPAENCLGELGSLIKILIPLEGLHGVNR